MALPSNIEKRINERFPSDAYHNGVRIEVKKFVDEIISEYANQWKLKYDELEEIVKDYTFKFAALQQQQQELKDKAQKLVDALQKIEQFSDPGSPERGIVEMKALASVAISEWKEGKDRSQDTEAIRTLKIIQDIKSFTDPEGFIKRLCDEVLGKEGKV